MLMMTNMIAVKILQFRTTKYYTNFNRFYCPIVSVIKFSKLKQITYKRKILLNDRMITLATEKKLTQQTGNS
jgi:hypothetical protein